MKTKTDNLLIMIDTAVSQMRSVGEYHWASWLEKDSKSIREGDLNGVKHFLSAFGGMGSINDLLIAPVNGHKINDSSAIAVNKKLHKLLSKAYDIAVVISRET